MQIATPPLKNQLWAKYVQELTSYKPVASSPIPYIKPLEFLCPLCLKWFDQNKFSEVTIEHVPPSNAGALIKTLTCRECNNSAGGQIDNHLHRFVKKNIEFDSEQKGASVNVRLKKRGKVVNGRLVWTGKKKFDLILDKRQANPNDFADFTVDMTKGNVIETELVVKELPDEAKTTLSILRSAYLLAFHQLGYSFILNNPNLQMIREQIANPDNEQIPLKNIVSRCRQPYDYYGIWKVSSRYGNAECHAIRLKLNSDNNHIWVNVLLPNRSGKAFKHIEQIKSTVKPGHLLFQELWKS